MINKFKDKYPDKLSGGVYYLSKRDSSEEFEELYLKLRTAEGRIYDDEMVRVLPKVSKHHRHYTEWKIRNGSSAKLIKYLLGLKRNLNILELGCGNGWLSNMLSEISGSSVIGIDINEHELKQAARVFGKRENLVFVYADIFNSDLKDIGFDIIILAGVMMYFEDAVKLIQVLKGLLYDNGEIHLIDNALYDENTIIDAKKNTLKHYDELGLPEMSRIINHHLISEFDKFNPVVLHNPKTTANKIKRKIPGSFESPFVWMKIS
jgi:SAM-dependent methyltransferase